MPALSDTLLKSFRERLRTRREQLRAIISGALLGADENFGTLAGQVRDAGDESVSDLISGLNLKRITREAEEIADIEDALERIALGTFGECIVCNKKIDPARLEAYPTAKRCIDCQTRHENTRRGGRDATPSL
jgi:DnaK suppressor protein